MHVLSMSKVMTRSLAFSSPDEHEPSLLAVALECMDAVPGLSSLRGTSTFCPWLPAGRSASSAVMVRWIFTHAKKASASTNDTMKGAESRGMAALPAFAWI